MKTISLLIVGLLLTGCAATAPKPQIPEHLTQHEYLPAAAAALAFDTPVFSGDDLPGLDRSAREAGVFIGYEDTSVESFSIGITDHQASDPSASWYDRATYTVKSGTRYR